jgi:hypothetical protein
MGPRALRPISEAIAQPGVPVEAKKEALVLVGGIGANHPKKAEKCVEIAADALGQEELRRNGIAALVEVGSPGVPAMSEQMLARDDDAAILGLATAVRLIGDMSPVKEMIGVLSDARPGKDDGPAPERVKRASTALIYLTGRKLIPITPEQPPQTRASLIEDWLSWWRLHGAEFKYK